MMIKKKLREMSPVSTEYISLNYLKRLYKTLSTIWGLLQTVSLLSPQYYSSKKPIPIEPGPECEPTEAPTPLW